jgi:hypothetical protein
MVIRRKRLLLVVSGPFQGKPQRPIDCCPGAHARHTDERIATLQADTK